MCPSLALQGCDFCAGSCVSGLIGKPLLELATSTDAVEFAPHSLLAWCHSNQRLRLPRGGWSDVRVHSRACTAHMLTGDTEYTSCEPACDSALSSEHCTYCRCKECKFCSVLELEAAVPLQVPSALFREASSQLAYLIGPARAWFGLLSTHACCCLRPQSTTECVSLVPGDTSYEGCDPRRCNSMKTVDACGTCR